MGDSRTLWGRYRALKRERVEFFLGGPMPRPSPRVLCPIPKASFFDQHQTPLALALALALPLALALAKGKHKHKGKGKHVWASMFGHPLTPSRRARWRIRRPTGDERARSACKVCPKSLSKVSVQSLCPKSLSKVSVNPLQVLPRPRTLRVRWPSWCTLRPLGAPLGRKSCLPKRLPTNFKKMSLT